MYKNNHLLKKKTAENEISLFYYLILVNHYSFILNTINNIKILLFQYQIKNLICNFIF